jgi:NADPH-dependent ferric siderophore reductase
MASNKEVHGVSAERIRPLGTTMLRVTFAPVGVSQPLHRRTHGGYCHLFFADPTNVGVRRSRAFTYRRWHADGRFDVDFVLHDGSGPAAKWLRHVRLGDVLQWRHGGPPKITLSDPCDDAAVLIADATALPLVSALIEKAHPDRVIRALMLLGGDRTPLPLAGQGRAVKVARFKDVSHIEVDLQATNFGPASLFFAACEAGKMKQLRRFALDHLRLSRDQLVTSGYWKAGLSAEEVDAAKLRKDWFADSHVSSV